MYMRLPMIVGNAGLFAAIGIVVVAHIISITTGLSVSSIATDKKVQAGGTYYMISRSLGLPIGGTLGLALFVGLSISVSLYLIGFSESFLNYWGFEITKNTIRITGSIILVVVTIITFISTSLALKTQYFIMGAIFLSLLSIFFGKHEFAPTGSPLDATSSALPLMVLFGIFFPAVTGFEAGVSMSGDLRDPKKSIPFGVITAILFGLVVYIGLVLFFSLTVDRDMLANDPKVLFKISRIPALVVAGIWGATLSSAFGSILGAPRILQATAVDKITPRFFAKGTGSTNEPRNALLLTFIIAEGGILIGELNLIARIVSIFFITTYGFLNLSCAFESMTSADFRPAFRTPAWISLLGSLTAMIVMIKLDFVALLGATVILGALYLFLKRKELTLQTGDAWSSVWASLVKTGLKKLRVNQLHSRNWRPNIIMFSGDETARPYMIDLGRNIAGKFGMLTGFQLVETSNDLLLKNPETTNPDANKADYFFNTHYCTTIFTGMDEIIRVYGYSGVQPNTVLMGWSRNDRNKADFLKFISRLEKNNFNSIFLHHGEEKEIIDRKKIDIWWSGWGSNLSFAINLIRHLTSSAEWKDSYVRLMVVTDDPTITDTIEYSLEKILENYRVDMEIKIIDNAVEQLLRNHIIVRESAQTHLVIVGIPNNRYEKIEQTYNEVEQLLEKLGNTLLINSSNTFESYDIIPDQQTSLRHTERKTAPVSLPDLILSKHPEIAAAIAEIDRQGSTDVNEILVNMFDHVMRENQSLLTEIDHTHTIVLHDLDKIDKYSEIYRKEKILNKIRNVFFYNSKISLEQFIGEKILFQKELIEQGLTKYLSSFDEWIERLQKIVLLRYNKIDFNKNNNDSKRLKRYKRRKRILHPFSKTLRGKVHFRKIVRYHLFNNRLTFIRSVLDDFQYTDLLFLSGIKQFINYLISLLDSTKKNLGRSGDYNIALTEQRKTIQKHCNALQEEIDRNCILFENRLKQDFRKSVQLLNNELDNVRINQILKEKHRKKKYYSRLINRLLSFPDVWYREIRNYANRAYLDLIIQSFRERIMHETDDLKQIILQQLQARLLSRISSIKQEIKKIKEGKQSIKKFPELNIDFSLDYLQEYEQLSDNIAILNESIPETVIISDESFVEKREIKKHEQETYNIPLRKTITHYVESVYIAPLQEYLQDFSDKIIKTIYRLKDHIGFMSFELVNIDPDEEDFKEKSAIILNEGMHGVEVEEGKLSTLTSEMDSHIDQMIHSAFEPVMSHRIIKSSREILHVIREYQGKRTVSRLGRIRENILNYLKARMVRILYSQSEGILLARKLTDDKEFDSLQKRILDLVEMISPDATVSKQIPAYYINLFSGKSNIGEDFWVKRNIEENHFEKALKRYYSIRRGAILIHGFRNSGKTALCRHLARKLLNSEQVFHLFPPLEGSSNVKDFEYELHKITGLGGSVYDILELIRHDSVLIFHDLELWWERTDNGLDVIVLIQDLIKRFSHKCLFIFNINSYSFNYINSLYQIENNFLAVIHCKPFDSEDLRNLIIRRHRSSGLHLTFGKSGQEHLSELRLARIFNKIFRLSEGNPGLAENIWLSMITHYSNEKLYMKSPVLPDFNVVEELPDDWLVILAQIVLHKRVTKEKLLKILEMELSELENILNAMLMCGIICEKTANLYVVNSCLQKALCETLERNELI
jgi:amino acid transporter